jgi:hypothetical protein
MKLKRIDWLWIIFVACIGVIIGLGFAISAIASEVPKQPVMSDCKYTPQRGDEVRQICDYQDDKGVKKLRGEGYIKLWICGEPYTIDIKCPEIETK